MMGIEEYTTTNDHFEFDEKHARFMMFPCCDCKHCDKPGEDEPCDTCGHNVNDKEGA